MSDEVEILRQALDTDDRGSVRDYDALDALERELVVNERAANDLFLENEALRSVLREMVVWYAEWRREEFAAEPTPEYDPIYFRALAYLGEAPA